MKFLSVVFLPQGLRCPVHRWCRWSSSSTLKPPERVVTSTGAVAPGGVNSATTVDRAAVIAQHEDQFDDPSGTSGDRHVLVDLRAARAVRIHLVGTGLACFKMKPCRGIAMAGRGLTIGHEEILLRELARAVEVRQGYPMGKARCSVGIEKFAQNSESVIACESGITAGVVVSGGQGHTTERKRKSRDRQDFTQRDRPRT